MSLLPSPASADFARYRCTGPNRGPVRVITESSTCRGFTTGGKQLLFSRMTSGTLLASKDGKTVVLVEDYLSGTRRDPKTIETDIDAELIANPIVVQIWRDQKRLGMYDIARLVKDVGKVELSISHVRWVASLPADIDGAKFAIVTTSGRRITFDSVTGAIVDERDVPAKSP